MEGMMNKEAAAKIRCDKCQAVCGNYQFAPGQWRCPKCIWAQKELLLAVCKKILKENSEVASKFCLKQMVGLGK
jgi:hypothetical protein